MNQIVSCDKVLTNYRDRGMQRASEGTSGVFSKLEFDNPFHPNSLPIDDFPRNKRGMHLN